MAIKPATLIFDSFSGWFNMGIAEQAGDIAKDLRYTQIKYAPIMGELYAQLRFLEAINAKWGTTIITIGHPGFKEIWDVVGKDEKTGLPVRMGRIAEWEIDLPGKGADGIARKFDELYHLVTLPNESGSNPHRKLFTFPHTWLDYRFEAKSRTGVKGPITNPTYDLIKQALPQGRKFPSLFCFIGKPGTGKTTLANQWPAPRLFIDMEGGTSVVAETEGTHVYKPQTVAQLNEYLRFVRDKGETK